MWETVGLIVGGKRIDCGMQEEVMQELSVGNICRTVQYGIWQLKKREKKHETLCANEKKILTLQHRTSKGCPTDRG